LISTKKIKELIKKIVSFYEPEKIILFGSYATGTAGENSDIDLLIVKGTDLPRPQRAMEVRRILFGSMVPMDIIVYTPDEIEKTKDIKNSLISEVIRSGKVMYER